jgi:hypothetical protein
MKLCEGRVAIVTGAGRGLGRAYGASAMPWSKVGSTGHMRRPRKTRPR